MSTLRVDNLQPSDGLSPAFTTDGVAKARVRYNQVSNTVVASVNVTSITDTAAGNWTVNLTNSMADANYSIIKTGHSTTFTAQANSTPDSDNAATTSAYGCHSGNTITGTLTDLDTLYDAIFGDLG